MHAQQPSPAAPVVHLASKPMPQHQSISIAWQNITHNVVQLKQWRAQPKTVLSDLSGHFHCGTLNCIAGPSGAGKTTLLRALSSGNKQSQSAGRCFVKASKQSPPASYFIEQQATENIIGELTVGQILNYAFAFKNGHHGDRKEQHIKAVMDALMLSADLLNRPFAQCSGGEQKRVAIAQELMAQTVPSFLFIDEPTTGLDSVAAFEVILFLQKLTQSQGTTVIASIHAPNQATLHLFDQVYVLAKGGLCIYSAPPRQIQYILETELQLKVPKEQPPIEAMIKIACRGPEDSNVQKLSAKHMTDESVIISHLFDDPQFTGFNSPRAKSFSLVDLITQTCRLSRITFLAHYRTFLITNLLLFAAFLFVALPFDPQMASASGCIALEEVDLSSNVTASSSSCQTSLDSDILLRENGAFLGWIFMYTGVLAICLGAVFMAPLVKALRMEHRNQWYSLQVFYVSSTLVSLLQVIIFAMVVSLTSYFFSSQHLADDYAINYHRLGLFFFTILMLSLYTQSIGQMIGTLFADYPQLTLMISILVNLEMVMFNDTFFNTAKTGITYLVLVADTIALKYLSKSLFYGIFGIDRCDERSEINYFLLVNKVDATRIVEYHLRVLANICLVKLATLALMHLQFNSSFSQRVVHFALTLFPASSKRSTRHHHPQTTIDVNGNETSMSGEKQPSLAGKLCIAWQNLSLFKSTLLLNPNTAQRDDRTILRRLNGQCSFGTLSALMGPSGAGKTSLLRVLNGQCKGRLGAESAFYVSTFTPIKTCFITQDVSSHLLPGLTAKQALVYASRLKNATAAHGTVDHEAVATKWLGELDLVNTANTKVNLCSGGERKRLAVALELTALEMPNLICIDEPTSGLDTNTAEIIISTLRTLSRQHAVAILASIHQPTTEILHLFDQLYVLALGGVCIYADAPSQMTRHLEAASSDVCKSTSYPIEVLLSHCSLSAAKSATVARLVETSSTGALPRTDQLTTELQPAPDGIPPNRTRFLFTSVATLLSRNFRSLLYSQWPALLIYNILFILFIFTFPVFYDPSIAVPSGCLDFEDNLNFTCSSFSSSSLDKMADFERLLDNYTATFNLVAFFSIVISSQALFFFITDYTYYRNERRNGHYSTGVFYLRTNLFEAITLLPYVLFSVYICNLAEEVRPGIYWHFVLVQLLASLSLISLIHVCTILSGRQILVQFFSIFVLVIVFILLSNFYLQIDKLHVVYRFIANFSTVRFALESFILLQYGFGRCTSQQIQPFLYSMHLQDGDYYHNLMMLLANGLLLRLIALYLLVRKNNQGGGRRLVADGPVQIVVLNKHSQPGLQYSQ